MQPTLRVLNDAKQSRIATAAFELQEQVGVKLTKSDAQTVLNAAGARAWVGSDQFTFELRVNAGTRELIESHQSEQLPEDVI